MVSMSANPTTVSDADLYGDMHREPSSSGEVERVLSDVWTDFLDANPDDLTSPEELPDHALMTGKQFVHWATEGMARLALRVEPPSDDAAQSSIEEMRYIAGHENTTVVVGQACLRAADTIVSLQRQIAALTESRDGYKFVAREAIDHAKSLETKIAERDEVLRDLLARFEGFLPEWSSEDTQAALKAQDTLLGGNEGVSDG
jgi:hypothetical protein